MASIEQEARIADALEAIAGALTRFAETLEEGYGFRGPSVHHHYPPAPLTTRREGERNGD